MKNIIARFRKDEKGATAIEYGLIAALVSVVIIVGLNVLGPAIDSLFNGLGQAVNNANTLGGGTGGTTGS